MTLNPNTTQSSLYVAMDSVKRNYGAVHPYLSSVICLTGILMNLASIVVLTRRSMIISLINCILAFIAACDGLTVTSYFYFQLRTLTFTSCRMRFTYEMIMTLLIHANLSVICHTVSIWLTVCMAVIRALTIRNVTTAAYTRSNTSAINMLPFKRAAILAAVVFFVTFLLNVPTLLSFVIVETSCSRQCGTMEVCPKNYQQITPGFYTASRIKDNGILLDAAFWITGIVFKMLPCLCLTVFIIVLIYILAGVKRRRERLRRNACDQNQRSDKTTFMLIVLLTVFLISELPQGILLILSGFDDKFRTKFYPKFGDLMDLLSLINGAANFVIYFIMSEKFRQVFCITLLPPKTYQYFFRNRSSSLGVSGVEMNNCNEKALAKHKAITVAYNPLTLLNNTAITENKFISCVSNYDD